MSTRRLLIGAALATSGFGPAYAQAPSWPQRQVRFVVAFAPGGFTDLLARVVAEHLSEVLGQPVVVENRAGAGGNVGAQVMARAAPDGYAALVTASGFSINLSLFGNPGYAAEQFQPVAVVAGTPTMFVVRADSPIRTLGDLVEAARRRALNYGSGGVGSAGHMLTELLFRRAGGTDATHVPYGGGAQSLAAMQAGTIAMVATPLPAVIGQIQGGQIRGIAVTSERRSQVLPDVPTAVESGFDFIVDANWVAIFFPAGAPPAVMERANAGVQRALERPALRQRLAAMGFEPIGGDLSAAQAFVAGETARWRDIVRTVEVRID
jgi:tripartite-type tricarboxylate transporter receptor subunit TctC